MRYGSVCSGIEAATSAWHSLGWTPQWFSEIEPFPSAVLAHHYPTVPNFGDMTKFKEWTLDDSTAIDVLVGGTPCQSFSVAGLRKGLDDPRGNLMLTYLAIANKYRPKWLVWENVPGVLSSNGGNDFASLLRGMGELGYGFAYRIFDAQHFGVPQRRRRVFVVGCLGDWRSAAAVLFERHSLSGHPAPSRKARQEVAGTIAARFGISRNNHEECVATTVIGNVEGGAATTLSSREYKGLSCGRDGMTSAAVVYEASAPIPIHDQATRFAGKRGENQDGKGNGLGIGEPGAPMNTLTKGDRHAVAYEAIPLDLRNAGRDPEKHDAVNRQGVGVGKAGDPSHTITSACVHGVAQPIAFNHVSATIKGGSGERGYPAPSDGNGHSLVAQLITQYGEVAGSLTARHDSSACADRGMNVIAAFKGGQGSSAGGIGYSEHVAPTLPASDGGNRTPTLLHHMAVRRLLPEECESLQGFPRGYTNIPWRKKPESPDGPRYKALGNSMAVPVMHWIGKRIQMVEDL